MYPFGTRGAELDVKAANALTLPRALRLRNRDGLFLIECSPRPGTKRVSRVEENTAADQIELSAKQIQRLSNLTQATGDRHDEANIAAIDH
jgi:hypothetical protein